MAAWNAAHRVRRGESAAGSWSAGARRRPGRWRSAHRSRPPRRRPVRPTSAPDLVRFDRALFDGTLLDRPHRELLTGVKFPNFGPKPGQNPAPADAPDGYSTYGPLARIARGRWVFGRGGGNAGSGATWNIYPDTGWVGVVLANTDDVPLQEIVQQETQANTGEPAPTGGGAGG